MYAYNVCTCTSKRTFFKQQLNKNTNKIFYYCIVFFHVKVGKTINTQNTNLNR